MGWRGARNSYHSTIRKGSWWVQRVPTPRTWEPLTNLRSRRVNHVQWCCVVFLKRPPLHSCTSLSPFPGNPPVMFTNDSRAEDSSLVQQTGPDSGVHTTSHSTELTRAVGLSQARRILRDDVTHVTNFSKEPLWVLYPLESQVLTNVRQHLIAQDWLTKTGKWNSTKVERDRFTARGGGGGDPIDVSQPESIARWDHVFILHRTIRRHCGTLSTPCVPTPAERFRLGPPYMAQGFASGCCAERPSSRLPLLTGSMLVQLSCFGC